jgi:hypothetical protein
LGVLKDISNRYDHNAKKPAWYRRLVQYFRELLKTGVSKKLSSFGYTAAVWRRASLSVFAIGIHLILISRYSAAEEHGRWPPMNPVHPM